MKTSAPASPARRSPRDPPRVGAAGQLGHCGRQRVVVGGEAAHAVPHDDVLGAGGEQQGHDRRTGCTGTGHHDPHVGQLAADAAQRVGQRSEYDDRRAVLVVVEDRDVEPLAQPCLDLEAARRGDVLEVDASEARRDRGDDVDDPVGVLGVEADRPRIDVGEPLEQGALALHHRQCGTGSDVAQSEYGGAVGDDRDAVALHGQPRDVLGVLGQREADPPDTGGVGHRQVVAGAQRHLGVDLDLAADVQQERAVGDLVDLDALQAADVTDDLVGVLGVRGRAGDVDHEAVVPRLRDVQRRDDAPAGAMAVAIRPTTAGSVSVCSRMVIE